MKKLILALMLSFVCLGVNAQTPEEAATTNKWIETFKKLDGEKDWNTIIAKSEECKAEVPAWEYVYLYCGIANYNLKQYDNAITNLSTFIEKNQTDALTGAYLIRGHSYSEKKDIAKAILDYDKFLEKNPNDNPTILAKANAYLNVNDLNGYINQLGIVLVSDPNNLFLLENRANAYSKQSNWQKALEDYNKLISIDSTKVSYYNNRAYANYSLKTPESMKLAISDYNKIVSLGGGNENIFTILTSLNKEIKDYPAEISAWDKLIKLSPDKTDYFYRRGTAKFNNSDFKGAIADFDVVLKADPKHLNALKRRYNSKNRIKDVKGSDADAKLIKALEDAKAPATPAKK